MCRHDWRQLKQWASDTSIEDVSWLFYCTKCLKLERKNWDENGEEEVED